MTKQFMRWSFASPAPIMAELPDGASLARIIDADLPEIAHIMVEGYRGTIDFEDETDSDALGELQGAMAGGNGETLRDAWLLARAADGSAASALATIRWQGMPFISYVFTAPEQKGRGYAGALIQHAAVALQSAGESELALFVTIGNPARSLYERLGFVAEPDPTLL